MIFPGVFFLDFSGVLSFPLQELLNYSKEETSVDSIKYLSSDFTSNKSKESFRILFQDSSRKFALDSFRNSAEFSRVIPPKIV